MPDFCENVVPEHDHSSMLSIQCAINVGQRQRCGVQSLLDQPPCDTERRGHFRGGPSGSNDLGHEGVAEPAGGPRAPGHLEGLLRKGHARAEVFIAAESPLTQINSTWRSPAAPPVE